MVKFSHSLQFNAVPDWASEYIAYSNLKKILYAIEQYNVQATIDARSEDIEQGHGISSSVNPKSSSQKIGHHLWGGRKDDQYQKKTAVENVAQEAELHNGSNIFPPDSAVFERELAKELVKVTSFYIRKERELSAELDAIDRQWQLEELRQKQERITQGEGEDDGTQIDSGEMNRRILANVDDEKRLGDVEKSQLKEMMGWEEDGLVDHGVSADFESPRGKGYPALVAGESTIADGSEYKPESHSHRASAGDLTDIVWRRKCLIEEQEEHTKSEREHRLHPLAARTTSSVNNNSNDNIRQGSSSHTLESCPASSHQNLDTPFTPEIKSSSHNHSTMQHQHRPLHGGRRSSSFVHDIVTGAQMYEDPNQRPSVYAPLTAEALLRRRVIDNFMQFSELKSYVALNYLGFQKIVKKHDKLAHCTTLTRYMSTVVDLAAPFQAESRQSLDSQIRRLQAIYASTCTNGNMAQAAKELRSHLREYIVWERNTIWREAVSQERKAEGARAVDPNEREPWMLFGYPIHFITAADARHILLGIIGIVIFAVLMSVSVFDTREQNRCFAILITVAFFWATEVMPLFATALLVPLLTILCQVMRDPNTKATLSTSAAAKVVFGYMFSPTIMLLLGGFTIASALSKYGIAKAIASTVLSRAGTDPKWVLLANMLVATISSMFISNVAAPVLCFSLVQSILRTLPHKSAFGPCLIMGIALASNVGGMASPISSPQNIITIQNMTPSPSWGNWFAIALPLCLVIDLIIWAWLIILWRPHRNTPTIPTVRATKDRITFSQVFICVITIGTIILWCIENSFQEQLGDMGVIAILPLVAFFGTGLLNKEDFNNFLWTVIMLAMGGIALGKAVDSSGLLDTIAHYIQEAVADLSQWVVLLIFGALTLVFATFVSHTVAAVIILPIVQQVGMSFADPHPRILVMGTGLICSAAMGLPVSGFPNMNAIALEDEMGLPYLKTMDFLKSGVPLSILATLVIVTMGYGIMSALGF
ncbi:SPX domain-domain-containing protein [Lobosporangium transversale]|uniref:SPX domain-domain-containing protein n=1 Tax=Lobosporangium transversale TaxID=64571 RepID=A0A1Y2GL37_9FUNG|nr:SPX domain-domain-containing protein [Lobosporangium transversale]ORZ13932.1 SPX domain-domain-containing protein [Lobosporangium transversale]|eukprot:XP_021880716.1 SPX domain-domain-containing protein [Lobosporangium transversale]